MTREKEINVAELRSRGIVKLRDRGMFARWVEKRFKQAKRNI